MPERNSLSHSIASFLTCQAEAPGSRRRLPARPATSKVSSAARMRSEKKRSSIHTSSCRKTRACWRISSTMKRLNAAGNPAWLFSMTAYCKGRVEAHPRERAAQRTLQKLCPGATGCGDDDDHKEWGPAGLRLRLRGWRVGENFLVVGNDNTRVALELAVVLELHLGTGPVGVVPGDGFSGVGQQKLLACDRGGAVADVEPLPDGKMEHEAMHLGRLRLHVEAHDGAAVAIGVDHAVVREADALGAVGHAVW